jgi:very-short-patch-repair endonuclease
VTQDWNDVDVVREQLERAARYVADGAQSEYLMWTRYNLRDSKWTPLESPLEAIYYLWWLAHMQGTVFKTSFCIEPQRTVKVLGQVYRLDFVLVCSDSFGDKLQDYGLSWPLIAVEVDGHGFHEKTPEQVALRNTRDRDLQNAGWRVFHYSWSEVIRDPAGCVGEVFSAGQQAFNALDAQLYKLEHQMETV